MNPKFSTMHVDIENLPTFDVEAGVLIPEEMARVIKSTRIVDQKYWYSTELGAAAYLKLNALKNEHKVFAESRDSFTANSRDIVETVFAEFEKWEKLPKIDFMGLGIGGGGLELLVLDGILEHYERNIVHKQVTFVLVDLSYRLVLYGLEVTRKKFADQIRSKILVPEPRLADFTTAKSEDFGGDGCRLITALGILHNATMPDILTSFRNIMNEKTLLLVDVEIIGGRTDAELCVPYNDDDVKRFLFNTMDLLRTASKSARKIILDGTVIGNYADFAGFKYDAERIHAEVVLDNDRGAFMKKYGLPSVAAKKIPTGTGKHSKTVSIIYEPPGGKPHVLGWSIRFHRDDLHRVLEMNGFAVCGEWRVKNLNTVYLLLKRAW